MQPAFQLVRAAGEGDLARRDRLPIDRRVLHAAWQAKRDRGEHMALETGDQPSHAGTHRFEVGAGSAGGQILRMRLRIGITALPGHIGFAAVPARMFDKDLAGVEADPQSHRAGTAACGKHLGLPAEMGKICGALDDFHADPPGKKQRTAWRSASSANGGSSLRQRDAARGQRGWKWHPLI
jgi:hypothetical protein